MKSELLKWLNKNQILAIIALGSFLGGALLTGLVALLWNAEQPPNAAGKALRESNIPTAHSEYKFIDPLISIRGIVNSPKYNQMQQDVSAYVAAQKANGLLTATVYFRDINEPGGFTLNPDELYTPASLYKVPVMMAYYKIAETDPAILSQEIRYPGVEDHNSVEEIRSSIELVPGNSYTVEQLIEHMIRYSDNNAVELLEQNLKDTNNYAAYTSVFSDLGIDPALVRQYTDNLTAQQYSLFLRTLYNSTYLTRADSEHALKLLSETDFSEGIESGVPNNILVAEKFGEVRMTDTSGTLLGKEINNCGIIYYPSHPYLLCIMTKAEGDDIKGLENDIASLSRLVYKNMQRMYP